MELMTHSLLVKELRLLARTTVVHSRRRLRRSWLSRLRVNARRLGHLRQAMVDRTCPTTIRVAELLIGREFLKLGFWWKFEFNILPLINHPITETSIVWRLVIMNIIHIFLHLRYIEIPHIWAMFQDNYVVNFWLNDESTASPSLRCTRLPKGCKRLSLNAP